MTREKTTELIGKGQGAIVCSHVAEIEAPILLAFRDETDLPEDSGWQFLCGQKDHGDDVSKVHFMPLSKVLELEPTLAEWIERPVNSVLVRKDSESVWEIHTEAS